MSAPPSRYRIALSGCDDETRAWIDLSPEQLAGVVAAAAAVNAASRYGCQPTMLVSNRPEALAREHDDSVYDPLHEDAANEIVGGQS